VYRTKRIKSNIIFKSNNNNFFKLRQMFWPDMDKVVEDMEKANALARRKAAVRGNSDAYYNFMDGQKRVDVAPNPTQEHWEVFEKRARQMFGRYKLQLPERIQRQIQLQAPSNKDTNVNSTKATNQSSKLGGNQAAYRAGYRVGLQVNKQGKSKKRVQFEYDEELEEPEDVDLGEEPNSVYNEEASKALLSICRDINVKSYHIADLLEAGADPNYADGGRYNETPIYGIIRSEYCIIYTVIFTLMMECMFMCPEHQMWLH
jgi:hypothetical protein